MSSGPATEPAATPATLRVSFHGAPASWSLSSVPSVSTLPLTVLVSVVASPSLRELVSATPTGRRLMFIRMEPDMLALPPLPWSWPVPAVPPAVVLLFWSLKV